MEGNKKVSTSQTILELLKRNSKGLGAAELAARLSLTPVAVRAHLTRLESERLLQPELKRLPLGRPSLIYSLTAKGEETFPRGYDKLLIEILDVLVISEGRSKLGQLFRRRAETLFVNWRPLVYGNSLAEKLERLTGLLNQRGYMAHREGSKASSTRLKIFNCPFLAVARRYEEFCCQEEKLWTKLLGTKLSRQSSLARGERACIYEVEGL